MNFLIVLFFASLFGIIFMVGRKLRMLASGRALPAENAPFQVPPFEEVREVGAKITKRLGYFILVEIIRLYVRISLFVKNKYGELKIKINDKLSGRKNGLPETATGPRDPNKFLKVIAQYKRKIGKIKREIKEEETNS